MGWEQDFRDGYDKQRTLHGKTADEAGNREAYVKGSWHAWHERMRAVDSPKTSIFGSRSSKSSSPISSSGSALLGAILLIALIGAWISGGSNNNAPSNSVHSPEAGSPTTSAAPNMTREGQVRYTGQAIYLCEEPSVRVCRDINRNHNILHPNAIVKILGQSGGDGQTWVHVAIANTAVEGWVATNSFSDKTTTEVSTRQVAQEANQQGVALIRDADVRWNAMIAGCPGRPNPALCYNVNGWPVAYNYVKGMELGSAPTNRIEELKARVKFACNYLESPAISQNGTRVCP